MSWGHNSKEKPMIENNFCYLVDFIRPTDVVIMVTSYTGRIFQLLSIGLRWVKNSKKTL